MDLNIEENIDVTKLTPEVLDKLEAINLQLERKTQLNRDMILKLRHKLAEYNKQKEQHNQHAHDPLTVW